MEKKCAVPMHQKYTKIFNSKTRNFIDTAVSLKRDVPNKYYDTMGDLRSKSLKSGLPKSERKTVFDEIAAAEKKRNFPGPMTFSPNKEYVMSRDKAILNYKGDRNGFLDDAKARGMMSPDFHIANYSQVEPRQRTPLYKGKIKADWDVAMAFKNTVATKNISPCTYNATQSYNNTQTKQLTFKLKPRRPGLYEAAAK